MSRQNLDKDGAFAKDSRDKVNDNFTELYADLATAEGEIDTLQANLISNLILDAAALAAAGSAQGDAAAIASTVVNATAADGTKGVILPAAVAGLVHVVYNSVATNGLLVYPATGETINGGSANAAVTIEGKTLAVFVCAAAGNWGAIFTADA